MTDRDGPLDPTKLIEANCYFQPPICLLRETRNSDAGPCGPPVQEMIHHSGPTALVLRGRRPGLRASQYSRSEKPDRRNRTDTCVNSSR